MSRKRYRPEEIIGKLRGADVLLRQGGKAGDVVKAIGVHEVSDYRWRKEYGGLIKVTQVKRLGRLEKENAQLGKPCSSLPWTLLSPERRRACVRVVCERLQVSERRGLSGRPTSSIRGSARVRAEGGR